MMYVEKLLVDYDLQNSVSLPIMKVEYGRGQGYAGKPKQDEKQMQKSGSSSTSLPLIINPALNRTATEDERISPPMPQS